MKTLLILLIAIPALAITKTDFEKINNQPKLPEVYFDSYNGSLQLRSDSKVSLVYVDGDHMLSVILSQEAVKELRDAASVCIIEDK
jgi:hypothetical protein